MFFCFKYMGQRDTAQKRLAKMFDFNEFNFMKISGIITLLKPSL